jgi:DNA-directed RNA polymerase subunit RPC12/RpoP
MRLEFSCTRCLTRFAAYRNGKEAIVAKCPGCGRLCQDPVDRDLGMRVRREESALILEPVPAAVPHGRFRCLDCGRESELPTGGPAIVCPQCRSGRMEGIGPVVTAIGLGQSGARPLTRAELKRQRFAHRWHANFETLRRHADGLKEAMVALEFPEGRRAEVEQLLAALVTEAEQVKEDKIERYLARSDDARM